MSVLREMDPDIIKAIVDELTPIVIEQAEPHLRRKHRQDLLDELIDQIDRGYAKLQVPMSNDMQGLRIVLIQMRDAE